LALGIYPERSRMGQEKEQDNLSPNQSTTSIKQLKINKIKQSESFLKSFRTLLIYS